MERLTYKPFCDADVYCVDNNSIAQLKARDEEWGDIESFYGGDAINKLASYEDMKEQGRLVELPCNIGDTVYEISGGRIRFFCVIGFRKGRMMSEHDDCDEIDCDEWCIEYSCGSVSCSTAFSAIGKTMFLTRKDAEIALSAQKGASQE